MKKNIFAIFDTFEEANDALLALEVEGYGEDDFSVIGQEGVLKKKEEPETAEDAGKGAGIGGVLGLIAGLAAFPIPGIGPVIATGTALSGLVSGAGIGAIAGGIIGFFRDLLGGEKEDLAEKYEEALKDGKILLAVTTTSDDEEEVRKIMENYQGHHIHAHDAA